MEIQYDLKPNNGTQRGFFDKEMQYDLNHGINTSALDFKIPRFLINAARKLESEHQA